MNSNSKSNLNSNKEEEKQNRKRKEEEPRSWLGLLGPLASPACAQQHQAQQAGPTRRSRPHALLLHLLPLPIGPHASATPGNSAFFLPMPASPPDRAPTEAAGIGLGSHKSPGHVPLVPCPRNPCANCPTPVNRPMHSAHRLSSAPSAISELGPWGYKTTPRAP